MHNTFCMAAKLQQDSQVKRRHAERGRTALAESAAAKSGRSPAALHRLLTRADAR
jgi:hypothetical protein